MSRPTAAGVISRDLVVDAIGAITVPGHLDDLVAAMAHPQPSVLRLRRGVDPGSLPITTEPIDWYSLARRAADPRSRPSRAIAYAAADYYLQDAGSLLALSACGADTTSLSGQMVCDLCAAPGGKASALVEAASASGFVLANEVIRSRLGALQLNLARTGSDRYGISSRDPDWLADNLAGMFDVVMVDAPCSGQTLVARGKQRSSSLSAKQIQHSAGRQQRILDAAVRLLRLGGQLIYSTCTFAEAENEHQVDRLSAAGLVEPTAIPRLDALEDNFATRKGCYRLWPHLHKCAGSFAACMTSVVRPAPIGHPAGGRAWQRKHREDLRSMPDLTRWYNHCSELRLQHSRSSLIGWPADAPEWVEEVCLTGPELAHQVGKTWKPSHGGALRRGRLALANRQIEVDDAAAAAFARGEPIGSDGDGWHVVCHSGRPLGWIKGNGRVGKNHLPGAARLPIGSP